MRLPASYPSSARADLLHGCGLERINLRSAKPKHAPFFCPLRHMFAHANDRRLHLGRLLRGCFLLQHLTGLPTPV